MKYNLRYTGGSIFSICKVASSHYGNALPFRLPNTAVYGSISCQYFTRPDATAADEPCLRPDIEIDLDDKDAAWKFVIEKYGAKQ